MEGINIMKNNFFAFTSRIKYLNRWALMRNTTYETLSSHAYEVATLSHALAIIGNKRLGKSYNAERAALLGLYHDTPEVITGDMPTPVKYHNHELKTAFKAFENFACDKLVSMLPEDMKEDFTPLFFKRNEDLPLWKLVKGADKISAYIKCIEERKAGNSEFSDAEDTIKKLIIELDLEEVKIFLTEFLPSYELPLDKLK